MVDGRHARHGGGKRKSNAEEIVADGRSILAIIWHPLDGAGATFHGLGTEHSSRNVKPGHEDTQSHRQLETLRHVTLIPAA
ncbi:hypothetical protein [Rhodococcus opacus]|uniref:Uncharacterized protein n=1 Tax=Rhodococcus opacus (strain B4) TaxID=632772 RepID=C1ASG9_RHOOB|nr:hypothetical protein [Rhodococcus opacus]BAH48418.1 hypothetical protein ROP_01710 [Rhodococcus opacus B4]